MGRSFLPTHNSELAAAVALLLCCGDGEERAEVYGCAADRQQAAIVFDVAADMVRMCPALNKRVKILASQKRVIYAPTNSFYQVLSAEAYSKHGFNVHGVVFDELHTQPNRKNMWEDFYSCYATVSNESPTEITAAGTVTDNSKIDFTVRWCNILSEITSDGYRVIFGSVIYDIIGIDHMNFKKKMLKIKCQKSRR